MSASAGPAESSASTAPPNATSPTPSTPTQVLRALLREISAERPRWGYRRAHVRLGELGHRVNRKRVQRLWREEGLRVPARRRKRQRLGESTVPADRLRAERPDHVWALDFQFDQTADGRVLKLLNVVDEFTREALAMHVARRIDADQTVDVLDRLANLRGAPTHVRCDNGPELTAHALRDWCRFRRAETAFIEPGSPWQNAYVESFNGRAPRRAARRRAVQLPRRSRRRHRRLAPGLQRPPTPFSAGQPDSQRFRQCMASTHRGTGHAIRNILLRTTSTDSHTRWTNHRGPVSWTGDAIEIIDQTLLPAEERLLRLHHGGRGRHRRDQAPGGPRCAGHRRMGALGRPIARGDARGRGADRAARPTAVNLRMGGRGVLGAQTGRPSALAIRDEDVSRAGRSASTDGQSCNGAPRVSRTATQDVSRPRASAPRSASSTPRPKPASRSRCSPRRRGRCCRAGVSRLGSWQTLGSPSPCCPTARRGLSPAAATRGDRRLRPCRCERRCRQQDRDVHARGPRADHGVPFYVAGPRSTFDPRHRTAPIEIEERQRRGARGRRPDVRRVEPRVRRDPAELITALSPTRACCGRRTDRRSRAR